MMVIPQIGAASAVDVAKTKHFESAGFASGEALRRRARRLCRLALSVEAQGEISRPACRRFCGAMRRHFDIRKKSRNKFG
jgi:hypothetical protein